VLDFSTNNDSPSQYWSKKQHNNPLMKSDITQNITNSASTIDAKSLNKDSSKSVTTSDTTMTSTSISDSQQSSSSGVCNSKINGISLDTVYHI
jgi:hypothetical protein